MAVVWCLVSSLSYISCGGFLDVIPCASASMHFVSLSRPLCSRFRGGVMCWPRCSMHGWCPFLMLFGGDTHKNTPRRLLCGEEQSSLSPSSSLSLSWLPPLVSRSPPTLVFHFPRPHFIFLSSGGMTLSVAAAATPPPWCRCSCRDHGP